MERQFNLRCYSVAASVIGGSMNVLNAQAIYVNIDPDTIVDHYIDFRLDILETPDDVYDDIVLENRADFNYDHTAYFWHLKVRQGIGSLAGTGDYAYPDFRYFPYALEDGVMIDGELSFYDSGNQYLAYRTFNLPPFSFYLEGGFWYPEKTDHYIGFRFLDSADCMHYGWIRCDVTDSASVLTVKDYAWETKCDVGIVAGDTIGDTTTVIIDGIISELADITIYCFNNSIYVILNGLKENYRIKVSDLNGKVIYEGELWEVQNVIPVHSISKGIYLVEVFNETERQTRKIIVG